MAVLTVTPLPGTKDYDGVVVTEDTMSAADTFVSTGREFVRVHNPLGTAETFTMTSIADALGRTKDISESIAAGATRYFGPFDIDGWRNPSGGTIAVGNAGAALEIEVIRIPSGS